MTPFPIERRDVPTGACSRPPVTITPPSWRSLDGRRTSNAITAFPTNRPQQDPLETEHDQVAARPDPRGDAALVGAATSDRWPALLPEDDVATAATLELARLVRSERLTALATAQEAL